MPPTELALSIDLGGTKCAAALIDSGGEINIHRSVRYGDASGDEVGMVIVNLAREVIAHAGKDHARLKGIGISVPGISYRDRGTVWAPNIRGWEDYPLRQLITDRLSGEAIPVFIESDRGCCILGESWLGAARGARHAVFLAVGTGIGAGILVDGRIVRGLHDIAGAIGWMALQGPYQDKYKQYGNFEYYASGDGLVRAAKEFIEEASTKRINRGNIDGLTSEDIFRAYTGDDPLAVKVITRAVELWGMASANLVSLFNPEKIIFGGGVFGPGALLIDQIYREASRWAQPVAIRQVRFLPSVLAGDAPLYGAAYQVFRNPGKKTRHT
jgi:glucokinase